MTTTWLRRSLQVAAAGPWPDPNPRVGCVLVGPDGSVVGEGFHRGAGTPHAEVAALAVAGSRARGATAYVSLEPCSHTGRTGPCAEALIDAGVARVVFAQPDPTPAAAGGAELLRAAGIEVVGGLLADEAAALNPRWMRTVALGRPLVTWKFAATLDGRSAALDGTSRWITGEESRTDVHFLRASRDAIVAGTGTVLVDDPRLSVRVPTHGGLRPPWPPQLPAGSSPEPRQPLRVVVGLREVPVSARMYDEPGTVLHLRTRDPSEVLALLWDKGIRDVWLEGGPTLAAAFVAAGLVDEVYAYLAPALLGSGRSAVEDLGITSITDIQRLSLVDVATIGGDIRIHAIPLPVDVSGRRMRRADTSNREQLANER